MNSLLSSRLYDNESFYEAFSSDLHSAKQSVIIESPFITTKRMRVLFPVISGLRRQGVHVVVNTRNPEEHDDEYGAQATRAIAMLQDIGVIVLYTVKHHRKLAIIDAEIIWEGSLNILSQNDSCEIMRRTKSMRLAGQLARFIGITEFI